MLMLPLFDLARNNRNCTVSMRRTGFTTHGGLSGKPCKFPGISRVGCCVGMIAHGLQLGSLAGSLHGDTTLMVVYLPADGERRLQLPCT